MDPKGSSSIGIGQWIGSPKIEKKHSNQKKIMVIVMMDFSSVNPNIEYTVSSIFPQKQVIRLNQRLNGSKQ